jgi:hypothetical protein
VKNPALEAYSSRPDLQKFGMSNGLILFALGMRHTADDVETIASQSLTDGPDDKKCDLVYVDPNPAICVIAQGYFSEKDRQAAESNKASDLNTAMPWDSFANSVSLKANT